MNRYDSQFFNFRKEIKEGRPLLIEEDTRFEREISPAEQIRFRENDRFADIVYDRMIRLIDGDITMEGLDDELIALEEELSPAQQEITRKIYSNLLKNAEGEVSEDSLTLSQLYKKRPNAPYNLFINYAKRRWNIPLSERISLEDVEVMPFGAVVVKISDKDVWDKIMKHFGLSDNHGFKIIQPNLVDEYETNDSRVEEKDYRYMGKQINRTVLIYTRDRSEEEIQEIVRHELFHDLYYNVISSVYESSYRNEEMDRAFSQVKDELVSYALSNRWQTEERGYFPNSYQKYNNIFNVIKSRIILDLLIEKHSKDKGEDKDKEEAPIELSEGVLNYLVNSLREEPSFGKAEEEANGFIIEIANLFREIARLSVLRNKDFIKATKAALTSQSLKEIAYKLSLIDSDKEIDAIESASEDDKINLGRAIDVIRKSIEFRIPIANLDKLVLYAENEMDSNTNIPLRDREYYQIVLDYYRENEDRWLRPGERRN